MSTRLKRIGRYELSKRLISGKTSEVWIAFDPRSQDYVTLKIFYTPLKADSDAILQFRQYVEQVASLKHPNIVPIRDIIVFPSSDADSSIVSIACIVMDYVEGQTLADYLLHTKSVGKIRPGADIVQLFSSLSHAIDYIHQQGIIHGNLNPGSILLKSGTNAPGQIGEPLLTDFDYARLLQNTGGTTSPFYLSPEQIRGRSASKQSDTYALGVILYELCTGVLPFRGNRPISIMMQHLNAPPTPPEAMNPTISSALADVILHGLTKEPAKRFPDASSLTIALAQALNMPTPEASYKNGYRALLQADTNQFTKPIPSHHTNGVRTPVLPASNGVATPLPPTAESRKRRKRLFSSWYLIGILVLLFASLGTMVTLLLLPRTGKATVPNQSVGHAYFLSSGQFNANSPQGINDELQIDLAGIPDPPAGKSYYAWLLADQNVSESLPILLGSLQVKQGNIRFVYPGDQQHINLLGVTSRFLITVDDIHHPTNNPLIDMSTWRYYAFIPLVPSPVDKLHFSMLDHMRHLLVESPELSNRNLHGGLAFWFVRNSATVSALANSARDSWHNKDTAAIHDQAIRILDYIDGKSFAKTDLPHGTPLLADARTSQIALLGPAPQNPDAPGYAYNGEVPPGYAYLISEHMAGAIQSSQTTPDQRKLAVQINAKLDEVKLQCDQIQHDAKQLLNMSNAQLLQPATQVLLNDLATQAQYAYTGQLDLSTGQPTGGALWIYNNLQRLAAFDIQPYVAKQ